MGQGKFCSTPCAMKSVSATESFKDARVKSGQTYKKSLAEGKFKRLSGSDHPQWTGGQGAAQMRRYASGKAAAYNRTYRKLNKERVREWSQKRDSIKAITGSLPRGTVKTIYALQRGKCANCNKGLNGKYHADHIMPLALGGKHEPANIQILCPPCNVRKWAYHPIAFAQKQGRLL
jgi:5-methylcytosine-specific restriction endonuclease McrA